MDSAGEIFEDFTPGRVVSGAPSVTLVDHDHIKKVGRNIFEDFVFFVRAGNGLIEGKVDFVGWINFPVFYFGHNRAGWLKIIDQRLVGQNI